MAADWIDTSCPHCGHRCEIAVPAPDRWAYGRGVPTYPVVTVTCPACGGRFRSDEPEPVPDDVGRDDEPLFSLDDDGEPDTEGLLPVTCPRCTHRFEVGEPGPTRCPFCRRVLPVDDAGQVRGGELLEPDCPLCGQGTTIDTDRFGDIARCGSCGCEFGTGPDVSDAGDCYDEGLIEFMAFCPNCWADQLAFGLAGDRPPVLALGGGRVKCTACRWEYAAARELLDILNDDWNRRTWRPYGRRERVIVSPDPDGNLDPLLRALEKVGSPGWVALRPGFYRGPVEVDGRDLTLTAAGPPGSVRIESDRGPALVALGGRVRLRGLTLVRHDRPDGWPEGAAVEADGARLRMDSCRVQAAGAAGVLVYGAGGRADLRDCDIAENGREGVVIERPAAARLRGCRVCHNGEAGVAVGRGRARLEACEVADNAGPGLTVRRGRVALCGGRVRGNAVALLLRSATAELAGCDLTGNRDDHADIQAGGRVVVCPPNGQSRLV